MSKKIQYNTNFERWLEKENLGDEKLKQICKISSRRKISDARQFPMKIKMDTLYKISTHCGVDIHYLVDIILEEIEID